jgi:WD40 repeat protein
MVTSGSSGTPPVSKGSDKNSGNKKKSSRQLKLVTQKITAISHENKQILSVDWSNGWRAYDAPGLRPGQIPYTSPTPLLATCGGDRLVKIWRVETLRNAAAMMNEGSHEDAGEDLGETVVTEMARLEDHYQTVNVVRWHPFHDILATGG